MMIMSGVLCLAHAQTSTVWNQTPFLQTKEMHSLMELCFSLLPSSPEPVKPEAVGKDSSVTNLLN